MKIFTLLFLSCLLLISACSKTKNDETNTLDKSLADSLEYQIVDMDLKYEQEKIALISVLLNEPVENTNSIVREYLAKTFSMEYDGESAETYSKILDTISNKYKLSKKRVSQIIFSFRYEMITSEDVIEDFMDIQESEYTYKDDSRY